jgi:hypothetical protein
VHLSYAGVYVAPRRELTPKWGESLLGSPAMGAGFDIAGRLAVELDGLGARDLAAICGRLDPYRAGAPPAAPDVVLAGGATFGAPLVDIQRTAGDGRVTASDGERFYVIERGARCAMPPPAAPAPARFDFERGFPIASAFGRLVRPALQVALHARGAVAVHAAAVGVEGRAVLVAGWSESGKTETALALVERGASFVSDKWTVVGDDASAAAFPITVGVRGWVLEHLPRLRAALGPAARARLGVAGVARAAARGLRGSDTLDRALTLADRVALTPTEVRRAYGESDAPWRLPLGAVAVLTTVPGPGVHARRADPARVAERLARTADFERRGLFELHDRACWALPDRERGVRERLLAHECAALAAVLAGTTVIEVQAPFPTDPGPVADAVARFL